MQGTRNYIEAGVENILTPLSTISSRTTYKIEIAVMLLYMMSGLNVLDILIGIPGGAYQIGINLLLAYYLKQLKSWARTGALIKAAAGVITNFYILGLHNSNNADFKGLTIVFLLYAVFPILLSTILLTKDVKLAYAENRLPNLNTITLWFSQCMHNLKNCVVSGYIKGTTKILSGLVEIKTIFSNLHHCPCRR